MERAVVGPCGLDHFVLRNLELVLQVDLVPQEFDRDLAGHAVDALDPVVQVVERLAARHVAHRENAASAVEVGLLEQLPESLLAHDVPDRHVDLQLARAVGTGRGEFLLRDLRAKGLNVLVIEVVEHESPDEGGLATAASPMRQTFTFILLTSINSRLALGIPGETRLNVMGALSSGIIDWPRGARPHRNVLRDGRMANDDVSSPKYGDRRWPDVQRIL